MRGHSARLNVGARGCRTSALVRKAAPIACTASIDAASGWRPVCSTSVHVARGGGRSVRQAFMSRGLVAGPSDKRPRSESLRRGWGRQAREENGRAAASSTQARKQSGPSSEGRSTSVLVDQGFVAVARTSTQGEWTDRDAWIAYRACRSHLRSSPGCSRERRPRPPPRLIVL